MLAVAARRSRCTHVRVYTSRLIHNMVRTRSRHSFVRGKTREKTGTGYARATCVPQTPSAALPFAKYHFGDRAAAVSSGPLLLLLLLFTWTRAYMASTHIFDSRIA